MLKKSLSLISFLFLLSLNLILYGRQETDMAGVITAVTGEVIIIPNEKQDPEPVQNGRFVYEGDRIETRETGICAVSLLNDIKLKINKSSKFTFELTPPEEKGEMQKLRMEAGQIWAKLTKRKTKFAVYTPITVVTVRGTEFDINLLRADFAEITVYEGIVDMKNDFGEVSVSAGQKATVSTGEPPSPPVPMEQETGKWQEDVKIKGKFDLQIGADRIFAGQVFSISGKVVDAEGNEIKNFDGDIEIEALPEKLLLSADGSSWQNLLRVRPQEGIFTFQARGELPGEYNLSLKSGEIWTELIAVKVYEKEPAPPAAPAPEKKIYMKIRTDDNKEETLIIKYKK